MERTSRGCFLLAGLGDTVPFSFTLTTPGSLCVVFLGTFWILVLVGAVLAWPHRLVRAVPGQSELCWAGPRIGGSLLEGV